MFESEAAVRDSEYDGVLDSDIVGVSESDPESDSDPDSLGSDRLSEMVGDGVSLSLMVGDAEFESLVVGVDESLIVRVGVTELESLTVGEADNAITLMMRPLMIADPASMTTCDELVAINVYLQNHNEHHHRTS